MAQDQFRHISVTAAEDDDVVIEAGLGAGEAHAGGNPVPAAVAASQAAVSASDAGDERPRAEEPRSQENPTPVRANESKRRKAADDYHETTLQDLQSEPMPLAQKVVIIAAIICIIGALIYYFAFMR